MLLDLSRIIKNEGEAEAFDYEMFLEDEGITESIKVKNPVKVSGAVKNISGVLFLSLTVKTALTTECDRCLAPIERDFEAKLDTSIVFSEENAGDAILMESTLFDVDKTATDTLYLNLPTKFVCKEDCKGICSKCGVNLNEGKCVCKKETDPRFERLKELLDK